MLVDPDLSRDQVVSRSLRLQSQEVAGLSVQHHLAYVVETIVIAADGAAAFVFGSYFDFMVQNAAHNLGSSAAARGTLNGVVPGGGGPEIEFCHHLGIRLRILSPEEAVFTNKLVRGLRARRLRFLYVRNDRLERQHRGVSLLSGCDGTE